MPQNKRLVPQMGLAVEVAVPGCPVGCEQRSAGVGDDSLCSLTFPALPLGGLCSPSLERGGGGGGLSPPSPEWIQKKHKVCRKPCPSSPRANSTRPVEPFSFQPGLWVLGE